MITVEGVTKRYGDVLAVDDLSFEVARGEVVGFLGPNGAGKSTTMKMITGTLQPDEGNVLFDGQSIAHDLIENLPGLQMLEIQSRRDLDDFPTRGRYAQHLMHALPGIDFEDQNSSPETRHGARQSRGRDAEQNIDN